jgi:DNA-directed RNA polymerase II subunit RPB1
VYISAVTKIVKNLEKDIIYFADSLWDEPIRGIPGIFSTELIKHNKSYINEKGTISRDSESWAIKTIGTNLFGILNHPKIDQLKVVTDSIIETYKCYGIEAARHRIMIEMQNIIDSCNIRHLMLYADVMTCKGTISPLTPSGLKDRERDNILLRAGYSSPVSVLEEAAINCVRSPVIGVSAPLILGTVPNVGTFYNSILIDQDFIRANIKSESDILSEL